MDLIAEAFKKILKKFFPKLYYSEKLQKFWFYLMLPSPTKIVIFLLALLIIVLIWGSFSTDNPMQRLTGFQEDLIIDKPLK